MNHCHQKKGKENLRKPTVYALRTFRPLFKQVIVFTFTHLKYILKKKGI